MVNEVGAGENKDSEVISEGWAGGIALLDSVVASVSIRRSLLAR